MPFSKYRELGYDKPEKMKDLRVACIFDPFTMQCFEPEVELITFTPENWRVVFEFNRPHIFMVESAWKGNNGAWKGKIANNIKDLLEIIKWCRENNITTIFWNKEDPVHYDFFIGTAKYFDYIFTTSIECVDEYKKDLNSENIYVLPFAAQPKIHNPTELINGRKNKICFAGSYYRNKYKERANDTRRLITASVPYGVDIYDRNYNLKIRDYKFPEEYQQYIRGVLENKEIVKANKGYKVALNLNTVKNSNTMFARRVFELLASNTPVVSNYSKGINKIFNGIVLAQDNKEKIEIEIKKLMTDIDYYEGKRIKGLREVLLNHTYEERMKYICNILKLNIEIENTKILVIAINENEEGRRAIISSINKQSFGNCELIFIDDTNCYDASYKLIGTIEEFDFYRYSYLTYMRSEDYYGENYILDLFLGTKYSDGDVIGKSTVYIDDNDRLILKNEGYEYTAVDSVNPESILVNAKSVYGLDNNRLINIFNEASEDSKKILSKLNKYSIDKFNYIKDYKGRYASEVER